MSETNETRRIDVSDTPTETVPMRNGLRDIVTPVVTVGRAVHYYDAYGVHDGKETSPKAATVTHVYSGNEVDLLVMYPQKDRTVAKKKVSLGNGENNTWSWPPRA